MSSATGAVDPTLAVSVTFIVVALAAALISVIGVIWRGFIWMDRRMDQRIAGWSSSAGFRAAVAEVVSAAFAPAADYQNRLHEEHRRAFTELRKRDDERADAVKRLHGRMDDLWKTVAK
jgi:DNA-binding GntR family transcriptional regulator